MAITAFWPRLFDAGVTGLALDPISNGVVGDTGIVTGYRSVTVPAEGGGTATVRGKELLIHKKQADGARQASRDILSTGR